MIGDEMSNEHARIVLERILATPEFAVHHLGKRLSAFLAGNNMLSDSGVDTMMTTGIIAVMIAGLALLIYLFRSMLPFWRVMVKEAAYEAATVREPARPSSVMLLKQADEKASRGEFRNALREIYHAALIELGKRSLITYQAAKTNNDYLREIRLHAADAAADFHVLAILFECKWYGLESCTQEDVNKGKMLYEALFKGGYDG